MSGSTILSTMLTSPLTNSGIKLNMNKCILEVSKCLNDLKSGKLNIRVYYVDYQNSNGAKTKSKHTDGMMYGYLFGVGGLIALTYVIVIIRKREKQDPNWEETAEKGH